MLTFNYNKVSIKIWKVWKNFMIFQIIFYNCLSISLFILRFSSDFFRLYRTISDFFNLVICYTFKKYKKSVFWLSFCDFKFLLKVIEVNISKLGVRKNFCCKKFCPAKTFSTHKFCVENQKKIIKIFYRGSSVWTIFCKFIINVFV